MQNKLSTPLPLSLTSHTLPKLQSSLLLGQSSSLSFLFPRSVSHLHEENRAMSNSRKKLLLSSVSVKLGCGSCRRPKLSHIFHPKPKPKNPFYHKHKLYSLSSSCQYDSATPTTTTTATATTTTTNTTFSPYIDSSQFSDSDYYANASRTVGGFGRVGGEGVAVEKDSDDPYLDFRHSMLQMILENEIYSKDDLRELLNCFLQLNSPYHHGVIVRAFTEIWNGVFSVRSSNSPRFHFSRKSRDF